jgi:hypothetical protein
MSYGEIYSAEKVMGSRVEERLRPLQSRRLVRQARDQRQNWLSRQARGLACAVGYRLVVMGAWLEGFSLQASRQN